MAVPLHSLACIGYRDKGKSTNFLLVVGGLPWTDEVRRYTLSEDGSEVTGSRTFSSFTSVIYNVQSVKLFYAKEQIYAIRQTSVYSLVPLGGKVWEWEQYVSDGSIAYLPAGVPYQVRRTKK